MGSCTASWGVVSVGAALSTTYTTVDLTGIARQGGGVFLLPGLWSAWRGSVGKPRNGYDSPETAPGPPREMELLTGSRKIPARQAPTP